jgi:hypothetical protein
VHAAEAIELRGFDSAWIEATISSPDRTEPDPRPGWTRSFKAIVAFLDTSIGWLLSRQNPNVPCLNNLDN